MPFDTSHIYNILYIHLSHQSLLRIQEQKPYYRNNACNSSSVWFTDCSFYTAIDYLFSDIQNTPFLLDDHRRSDLSPFNAMRSHCHIILPSYAL